MDPVNPKFSSPTLIASPCGPQHIVSNDFAFPASLPAPPVVVRLAGLPAQALEPLTSVACTDLLQVRRSLEEELEAARRLMVETIGTLIPLLDPATRRFLLEIKRSCFNGREIVKFRSKAKWAQLIQAAPELTEQIATLEVRHRENERAFEDLYEKEFARERRHVLDLTQNLRFLRGVALGRPGLVQKIRAEALSLVESGFARGPVKWEQSLLRFVTRTAAKLSANSTLSVYALGSVQDSSCSIGYRFIGSPQREVSLVRIDRPELEQFQALLMRHPAVRAHALVAWNDSLEELAPGQYRFLRDARWELDPRKGFQHLRAARITVKLSKAVVNTFRDALREKLLRYDALSALLEGGQGKSGDDTSYPLGRSAIDQLIDLGILVLMPPWPPNEARLEQRICQFLLALPDDPTLRATAVAINDLLTLEDCFAYAPRPESAVTSMKEAFSRLLGTATHLASSRGPLTTRVNFFEDVLSVSTLGDHNNPEVFQIASSVVNEILQNANLVSRFAGLFNYRHDLLHTLAAWWRENAPSRREMPFTEIARGFTPLWKQFLQFTNTAHQSRLETFNPLYSIAAEELRELRKALISQYVELLSKSATRDIISAQEIERILTALPSRYSPLVSSGAFVQPVDAEGKYWVLNSIFEGTGRFLSRVLPVLEGPLQQSFLHHLIARSVIVLEEEEADLLEVQYPWGVLVSAHPPQALRVLEFRGLHLHLPPDRRVDIGDLRVQADLEAETFRLIMPSGRRVLPVNLSTLGDTALPNLLRLLLAFGPGETRKGFPFSHSEGDESFRTNSRLTCGNLILRRRSWMIDVEDLRHRLQALSDFQSYVVIQNWRQRLGLPSVAFYSEITHRGTIKPQYVDFSSPSLGRLFASSLRKMTTEQLTLEEALPLPADFPLDQSMNRRAFEILIDSLATGPVGGGSFARP